MAIVMENLTNKIDAFNHKPEMKIFLLLIAIFELNNKNRERIANDTLGKQINTVLNFYHFLIAGGYVL